MAKRAFSFLAFGTKTVDALRSVSHLVAPVDKELSNRKLPLAFAAELFGARIDLKVVCRSYSVIRQKMNTQLPIRPDAFPTYLTDHVMTSHR